MYAFGVFVFVALCLDLCSVSMCYVFLLCMRLFGSVLFFACSIVVSSVALLIFYRLLKCMIYTLIYTYIQMCIYMYMIC